MSFEIAIQIDPELLKGFNKMTVVFSPQKVKSASGEPVQDIASEIAPPAELGTEKSEYIPKEQNAPIVTESKRESEQPAEPETQASGEPDKTTAVEIIPAEKIREVAAVKGREKVKALLDKHNFSSISKIPDAERSAFLEELKMC